MVVAHNLGAMNAERQYNLSGLDKKKSTEKLSSGFRINRAADDAAGLSISEKMRKQIRGLDRGANNIQEGISLVQTADGALGEVVEILQRIRELSIQSYNETNSQSDIAAMQAEVDEALKEIDRIGETTTFNEMQILQGNKTTASVQVTVGYYESKEVYRTIPEWLINKSDSELKVHDDPAVASYYSLVSQDPKDGVMYQTISSSLGNMDDIHQKNPDGSDAGRFPEGTKIYFGKRMDNIEDEKRLNLIHYSQTYQGQGGSTVGWTQTVLDNPTAKLDFSGLKDVSSADELYRSMFNLLGTSVSYPCGSCSAFQRGVFFSGEVNGFRAIKALGYIDGTSYDYRDKLVNVDLTASFSYDLNRDGNAEDFNGYFAAINALKDKQKGDTVSSAAAKQAEAKALADAIAKNLASRTADALSGIMTGVHFDRAAKADDYSLIVYDIRDKEALRIKGVTDAGVVNTTGRVEISERKEIVENRSVSGNMTVHSGPGEEDKIGITLPKISLKDLNLVGYRVGVQYITETIVTYEPDLAMEEQRDKEYKEKLAQYELDMEKYRIDYAEWESSGRTESYSYEVDRLKDFVYDNGEVVDKIYEKVTVSGKRTVYDTPPPKMPQAPVRDELYAKKKVTYKKIYDEHTLDPVDEALAKVSAMRSKLGAEQNRMEHAYLINTNTSENTTAAESRIRDTDMAKEMVSHSKSSILEQVGQSMMAQANQANQGVLNLLR